MLILNVILLKWLQKYTKNVYRNMVLIFTIRLKVCKSRVSMLTLNIKLLKWLQKYTKKRLSEYGTYIHHPIKSLNFVPFFFFFLKWIIIFETVFLSSFSPTLPKRSTDCLFPLWLFKLSFVVVQDQKNGHLVRIEFTINGLPIQLFNNYTTRWVPDCWYIIF